MTWRFFARLPSTWRMAIESRWLQWFAARIYAPPAGRCCRPRPSTLSHVFMNTEALELKTPCSKLFETESFMPLLTFSIFRDERSRMPAALSRAGAALPRVFSASSTTVTASRTENNLPSCPGGMRIAKRNSSLLIKSMRAIESKARSISSFVDKLRSEAFTRPETSAIARATSTKTGETPGACGVISDAFNAPMPVANSDGFCPLV